MKKFRLGLILWLIMALVLAPCAVCSVRITASP
jgi:hypothetical protein